MISKFFKTSKPIHFVIVLAYILVVFLVSRINIIESPLSIYLILRELGLFLIIVSSVFLLDFFVKKNNITFNNSYKILLYALLLGIFPMVFKDQNVLIANVFILIAFRRIVSIKSRLNVKKKLFDAGFWVGIASLFYFWSILFFGVIIAALLLYSITQFKNWIVPFVGLLTVILITISYSLLVNNSITPLYAFITGIDIDMTVYNNSKIISTIFIVTSIVIWSLLFYIKNLKEKMRANRPSFILILVLMLAGLGVLIITPDKTGSEFLFSLAPLAIVITNYLESIKNHWLVDTFMWILILTPIPFLFY